ncbi:MAG TPA: hypothetical protein VE870_15280 [Bacteroidales bacterium]|nr:hypothetical protein [Bacteroidales bacterium]
MKKLASVFLALVVALSVNGQTDTTKTGNVKVIEKEGKTVVKIGKDNAVTVEESDDTTHIKLGNRGITVIESEDGTKINMDQDEENNQDNGGEKPAGHKKFKGHWAGFQVGLNNYVDQDFSMSRSGEDAYMDLNTGRSWNFNINFMEYSLGLGTDKLGLVTGLGMEWSNYHFDNNNNIVKDDEGVITVLDYPDVSVNKSKLQTTYLTAPLLLEGQIPAGKKRIHISAGVIGGLKLGSNTKVVYRANGNKQKDKTRDDFNLSPLRYGLALRVGYKGLNVYANYYLTPLFETGKGPELYPFAIGLTLLNF